MKKYFSLTFFLFFVLSYAAKAEIKLPQIFSDNMVLQRNQEIPIWGWADKNEQFTITFNEVKKTVKADKKGNWRIVFPEMNAGGPFKMLIQGKNEITLQNIMIGEVWICSGQSNMEWPVSKAMNSEKEIENADYPAIRLFDVPYMESFEVKNEFEKQVSWKECSPKTVVEFSAVGYFFGRELYKKYNVPIGLINSSVGGSAVETWMSSDVLQKRKDLMKKIEVYQQADIKEINPEAHKLRQLFADQNSTKDAGCQKGNLVWAQKKLDISDWKNIAVPGFWEQANVGLKEVNGIIWYRRAFYIPEKYADKDFTLSLGAIDDGDMVWINGKFIGETPDAYSEFREYKVPGNAIEPGLNMIAIRVLDYFGNGGFSSSADDIFIRTDDFKTYLSGHWRIKPGYIAPKKEEKKEDDKPTYGIREIPSVYYNSMIHPVLGYGIRGSIWYQGEANASRAWQYRSLFREMIINWRDKWGQGDFPFLYVQLANFETNGTWAELREAQREALSLPNTGMAVTIDIGNPHDIHPLNKQEVGRRLALDAYKIAYNENIIASGPSFESIKIENNKAKVNFKHTGSGLTVNNKYGYLMGFEIAGKDNKFHFAKADIVNDNSVVVYTEKVKHPVAVRYAWSDNPEDANLYNNEGLPALPFRSGSWEWETKAETENIE